MKTFDIMDACEASAKDFCNTLLACLENDKVFTKEDGFLDEDYRKEYKEYLDRVLEIHYNTDIGEQGENITNYLDECGYYDEEDLTLLQKEEHIIEKWLKENGYTTNDCVGAGFEPIDGHQGRAMDFEYNGNIAQLDVDELADSIAENVIDDRFSVRVFVYDQEEYKDYENMFCVEIRFNE